MKNKTIKKALAIGMSVLMLASTFTPVSVQAAGGWKQNKTGWWWEEDNGSYPTKSWKNIGGTWYYFDGNGYMVTGWLKLSGGWYYLTGSGAMATGWVQVGSTWYYMNESGVMQADTWIGDNYVDGSGAWIHGKAKTQTGWVKSGNRWWYSHADGSYTTNNWEVINGSWYYFDGSGWMVTGWLKRPSGWYYLTGSGAMATGWVQVGSTWYYMNESGVMQADTWIGDNYVDGSGAWIPGKVKTQAGWVKSGNHWWYRHADGGYTTNGWEMINGTWYYFDGSGWMVTGWKQVNGSWYYMDASGAMVKNAWVGDYYLGADGAMATNTWIGQYYVDGSGKWVPNKQKEPEKQEIALKSINLSQTSASLWTGEELTLQVTCNPSDTTVDKSVTWSSSDESVATVENGKVKGIGKGTATITAEVAGKKATCEVDVVVPFNIVSMSYEELGYLPFGTYNAEYFNGGFSILPEDYDLVKGEDWSISDETIAKLEVFRDDYNGDYAKLTGLKEGTVTLTATYKGKSVSMDIITKKVADLKSLSYPQETYTAKVGEKLNLYPEINPTNTYLPVELEFESSNPEVATIDSSGIVRAKKEGYTTITASKDRMKTISTSCTVKVEGTSDNTELEIIRYEGNENEYYPLGVKIKLPIAVYPATYQYKQSDLKLTILEQGTVYYGGEARIEDGEIIGTSEGAVRVEASLGDCEPIRFQVIFSKYASAR